MEYLQTLYCMDVALNMSDIPMIDVDFHISTGNKYDSIRNFHVHCPKKLKKKCKHRQIFSDNKLSYDIISYFKPNRIINIKEYNYLSKK